MGVAVGVSINFLLFTRSQSRGNCCHTWAVEIEWLISSGQNDFCGIKYIVANIEPFRRFLGNSEPAWSFVYYSKAILINVVRGLCIVGLQMAIFALPEVFPFSYLPHILKL